ncbi:GNAT family N-acetyltransferase [Actinoplanes sp. NPDC051343]|uniref:GNAT family N-acetyltransferase n=1 Tax=Actinoplanes sp. NPDC051343 TaxID=3363906 RepID=UPI0037BA4589
MTEAIEADFMYEYGRCAPVDTLGVGLARIGGGVAVSMRNDPTRYWSKALGFTAPITADLIDEVLDFYRKEGNPHAVLQIAPDRIPADWAGICASRGIRAGSEWVKLAASIRDIPPAAEGPLRVGRVTVKDADEWAGLVTTAFGMTAAGLPEMLAATAGDPRFQPYAVRAGDSIVAGGNLFIAGDVASLNAAATAPEFRGRGAQTALIHARIEAARAAGCRIVVAETGKPEPGENNRSLNNLRRAGLQPCYPRRNWIWSGG